MIDLSQADQSPDTVVVTGFENVTGSARADAITGGAGADDVDGGAGDDTIVGFVGADTVDGGDDDDTITLAATSADLNAARRRRHLVNVEAVSAARGRGRGVVIDLAPAERRLHHHRQRPTADTITGGVGRRHARRRGRQRHHRRLCGLDPVDGGADDDTLTLAAAVIDLNAAGDGAHRQCRAVSAALGRRRGVVIDLGAADRRLHHHRQRPADTITGGAGADIIDAGAGDDTIVGFTTGDTVDGGGQRRHAARWRRPRPRSMRRRTAR